MKKLIEYRLHLKNNVLSHPDWITDGGYFLYNNTYIAIIENDADRKFYIPDTLLEISLEELKNRVKIIQNTVNSIDKITSSEDNHVLTDLELDEYINQWYSNKVL